MLRWYERLASYFDWQVKSEEKRRLHDITERHAKAMIECSQSLGLLDCASDDVLVRGGKVTFLDFEYIGYDWPDARLYGLCSEFFDRADKGVRRRIIQAYIGAQKLHGHFFTEEEVMSRILAIADHNHLGRTAYLARIVRSSDESAGVGQNT
jgi:Ser/Thr protein kinase RdoA (MazF antagonist)